MNKISSKIRSNVHINCHWLPLSGCISRWAAVAAAKNTQVLLVWIALHMPVLFCSMSPLYIPCCWEDDDNASRCHATHDGMMMHLVTFVHTSTLHCGCRRATFSTATCCVSGDLILFEISQIQGPHCHHNTILVLTLHVKSFCCNFGPPALVYTWSELFRLHIAGYFLLNRKDVLVRKRDLVWMHRRQLQIWGLVYAPARSLALALLALAWKMGLGFYRTSGLHSWRMVWGLPCWQRITQILSPVDGQHWGAGITCPIGGGLVDSHWLAVSWQVKGVSRGSCFSRQLACAGLRLEPLNWVMLLWLRPIRVGCWSQFEHSSQVVSLWQLGCWNQPLSCQRATVLWIMITVVRKHT